MLDLRKFFTISLTFKRHFSNVPKLPTSTCVLKRLEKKSLISVVGEEVESYLQGLITNDMMHLSSNCSSIYAMFLNSKGRVLYDSIIYKIDSKTYYVECDEAVSHSLEKHLKMYRLRRKIDVFLNGHQIHVMFDRRYYDEILQNPESSHFMKHTFDVDLSIFNNNSLPKIFKDPRISQLGYRIISEDRSDVQSILSDSLKLDFNNKSTLSYQKFRYSLGVGEGATDLPSGSCFPLESNCDYLHGVSFHKGCYIGQELTARTHHTGVTRKRLMPIYFNTPLEEVTSEDLLSSNKIKVGKLRGLESNFGLALIRLDLIKPDSTINVAGTEAVAIKPFWWPIEAPKERKSLKKL